MDASQDLTLSASTTTRQKVAHGVWLRALLAWVLLAGGCTNPTRYIVGLKPVTPEVSSCTIRSYVYCDPFSDVPHVDTLHPTFHWQEFPKVQDLQELGPRAGKRIADVSYELRLGKVGQEFFEGEADLKYSWGYDYRDTDPGELVYRRQGIRSPYHTLETSLQPNSLYFWSIRAHFTLDGRRRATEWSQGLPPEYKLADRFFPNRYIQSYFHPFRT